MRMHKDVGSDKRQHRLTDLGRGWAARLLPGPITVRMHTAAMGNERQARGREFCYRKPGVHRSVADRGLTHSQSAPRG